VPRHSGELPDRLYAVIVDEAHSSQSGKGAVKMKAVLAAQHIRTAPHPHATRNRVAAAASSAGFRPSWTSGPLDRKIGPKAIPLRKGIMHHKAILRAAGLFVTVVLLTSIAHLPGGTIASW
jgi:hypothetical protein